MARHGIKGVIGGGSADGGALPRVIHAYRDALARVGRDPGLERINVAHPVGTPQSVILEQLQQFAEEVMPAFTNRVTEPVAVD
jgi:hypothetical protein